MKRANSYQDSSYQEDLPYSISYFLHKNDSGKHILYCRIILARKKCDFSLRREVELKDWDLKWNRYRQTLAHLKNKNFKLATEVEGKIAGVYLELKRRGAYIEPVMLKDGYREKKVRASEFTLITFLDAFIEEIRTKPQEYTPGTIHHYTGLKNHLFEFLKAQRLSLKLPLESFNRNMLDRFDRHLLTWKNPKLGRSMNRNSANKSLKKLKTVMLNAIKKQFLTDNPFTGFVIHNVRVNKVALTAEELELLRQHDLGGNVSLQNVRNLFIFAAMTGLRYSDAAALSPSDITKGNDGRLWITITQRKTQDPLHVPMIKEAERIYLGYKLQSKSSGRLLVPYSNVKINLYLKEIARVVNIKKRLTHHVARHTFGTLALESGIDIKTVSHLLGHTSIKSTECYARVTNKLLSDTLTKLEEGNTPFSTKTGKDHV